MIEFRDLQDSYVGEVLGAGSQETPILAFHRVCEAEFVLQELEFLLEEFDLLAAFLGLYIFDETSHSQEESLDLEQVVAMFPCRREWDSHGPTLEGIAVETEAETAAQRDERGTLPVAPCPLGPLGHFF